MPITLERCCSASGDKKAFFNDVEPAERTKLAAIVEDLKQQGHAVFLIDGNSKDARRIQGYDKESNEWLVFADPVPAPQEKKPGRVRRTLERVAAAASRATAIGPTAGG